MKKFTYRGTTIQKPDNVSARCAKRIIEIASGFDNVIQPFVDLLSSQISTAQPQAK